MVLSSILAALLAIIIFTVLGVYIWLEGSLLPRKSTREFWKLSQMPALKRLEGYFYAARPRLYLKPVTWPSFRRLLVKHESAETYHGKVITFEDARKIITLNEPVCKQDLDQIIPYQAARSIILNAPFPAIAVVECPCRAQKKDSCPRDVCLAVGEPFVSFAVEHSPNKARRIEVAEALRILDEEEKQGHIHTAWFKDAMHNRFYTICNCCSCCCLGMESYFRGVARIIHSGYRPLINTDDCLSCGCCVDICPFRAIQMEEEQPAISNVLCMGCGLCASHCPSHAITLNLAADRGVPLDVDNLKARRV